MAIWAVKLREGPVPERQVKAESVKGRRAAAHLRPLTLSGSSPISGQSPHCQAPPEAAPRGSSKAWPRKRHHGKPPFVLPGRRTSILSPGRAGENLIRPAEPPYGEVPYMGFRGGLLRPERSHPGANNFGRRG